MATTRRVQRPRLVTIDGTQVAPLPPRSIPGATKRQEQELLLLVIKEHLGHFTYSLARLYTLTRDLEANLGICLPDYMPWERPDPLNPDHPKPFNPSA